ncbi:HET domain-containing protein [Nemania sp. FL0031]|nr:HET domain-containing protein [Nemania sp. FL0031]
MGDASSHAYSTLQANSIRLINLGLTEGLSITLQTINIKETPPYFALSYAWDAQSNTVPIEVNGQIFSISLDLAEAILRLRTFRVDDFGLNNRVEWVWIDKICINQEDFAERSNQVQIMNLIYARAIRTLIWLGADGDACSGAWQLVDQIYGIFRTENPDAKFIADIPFRIYSDQYHESSMLPKWDHKLWWDLRRLFKLPWFTRTWIIQEVALSQEDPILLHGQHRYPWSRLGWASSWLRRNGYLRLAQIPNRLQNVDTISNIRRSRAPWRLDALLVTTSIKFHATDQRDKLYGLLGLAAESQNSTRMPLLPNYELGVTEIYTKLAHFFIQEYKSLSVLTRANGVSNDTSWNQRKHRFDLLPSWVPNWCDYSVLEREVARFLSWLSHPNTTGAVTLGFPEHYNASCRLPVRLIVCPNPSILKLSGLRVDRIVGTTQFEGGTEYLKECGRGFACLQLWKVAVPFLLEGKPIADWVGPWIKTTTAEQHLLCGRTAEQMFKDGVAYLYNVLSSGACHHLINSRETTELLHELSMGGDAEAYAALASNFCLGRKFIITLEGRLGIGPTGAQPGDLIFVLFGGGVPYILRKQGTGFLFVGESYIHGLMGGEAVQSWHRGELVEDLIELR